MMAKRVSGYLLFIYSILQHCPLMAKCANSLTLSNSAKL